MLNLITYPNPILNNQLPEFNWDDPVMDPKLLEEQLVKLMWEHNGIGLAANQAGIETRVFAIMTRNLSYNRNTSSVFQTGNKQSQTKRFMT